MNNWLLSLRLLLDDRRCILPKSNELLARSANAWLLEMFENCLEDFFLFICGGIGACGGYFFGCLWFRFYLFTARYLLPFERIDLFEVLERFDCLLSSLIWLFLDLLLLYLSSFSSKLDLLYLIFSGNTSD